MRLPHSFISSIPCSLFCDNTFRSSANICVQRSCHDSSEIRCKVSSALAPGLLLLVSPCRVAVSLNRTLTETLGQCDGNLHFAGYSAHAEHARLVPPRCVPACKLESQHRRRAARGRQICEAVRPKIDSNVCSATDGCHVLRYVTGTNPLCRNSVRLMQLVQHAKRPILV